MGVKERLLAEYNRELKITPYFLGLMKAKRDFQWFPHNDQVLVGEEIDEFNEIHGLSDTRARYSFKRLKAGGYAIHKVDKGLDLIVPDSEIDKYYKEVSVYELCGKESTGKANGD